jgi:hypothetical protein
MVATMLFFFPSRPNGHHVVSMLYCEGPPNGHEVGFFFPIWRPNGHYVVFTLDCKGPHGGHHVVFFSLGDLVATRWFWCWTPRDHMVGTRLFFLSPRNHLVATRWFQRWNMKDHMVATRSFFVRLKTT